MNLCRVCLEIPKVRIELTQDYCKKFFHITDIEISDTDGEFLCENCLNQLIAAWDFREEAKNADDWFRNQPDIIVKELSPEREPSPVKELNDSVKDEIFDDIEQSDTDDEKPVKKVKKTKRYYSSAESDPDYDIPKHHRAEQGKWFRTNEDEPYECHYCGEKFHMYYKLRRHLIQHRKQLNLICKYCGKKFSTATKRLSHEYNHQKRDFYKGVTFVCDICGTSKPTRRQFAVHMVYHRKDAKHQCTIQGCQDFFRDKRSLYKHIHKAHGIAHPFFCEDCGTKYKTWHTLRTHRRQAHKEDAKEHLKCQECGQQFLTEKRLNEHIAAVHRGERNFRCLLCTSTYTHRSNLMRHYKTNHDGQWQNLVKEGKLNARKIK